MIRVHAYERSAMVVDQRYCGYDASIYATASADRCRHRIQDLEFGEHGISPPAAVAARIVSAVRVVQVQRRGQLRHVSAVDFLQADDIGSRGPYCRNYAVQPFGAALEKAAARCAPVLHTAPVTDVESHYGQSFLNIGRIRCRANISAGTSSQQHQEREYNGDSSQEWLRQSFPVRHEITSVSHTTRER